MNFKSYSLRILCEKLCVFFAVKKITAKNTQSFSQNIRKEILYLISGNLFNASVKRARCFEILLPLKKR